jgi:hypothetical protein
MDCDWEFKGEYPVPPRNAHVRIYKPVGECQDSSRQDWVRGGQVFDRVFL